MKKRLDFILIALSLVAASAALYVLHYALFADARHIWIYLVGDIAFLPLEVLLVALVIERLLARRERVRLLRKMNMVIGTFFGELGTRLLGDLTPAVENQAEIGRVIAIAADWTPRRFEQALARVGSLDFRVNGERLDLAGLKKALAAKRDFLVLLLANPNLLEHEPFTDLLWSVFHLTDELQARASLENLPASDRRHLAGDAQRVYERLAREWLRYCRHLQKSYPYIFSIVLRTHPLQARPSPTVIE
jgi:hypothetical protein